MGPEIQAYMTAADLTARHARGALPDAPVIADFTAPEQRYTDRIRSLIGSGLFAAARRISPATLDIFDHPADFGRNGETSPSAC